MLDEHINMLNEDQKIVYDSVIHSCNSQQGGFFFVYGYGGIGKTFLQKTLSFKLHSKKNIVLNVASSDISSFLLPSGKIVHYWFTIPLTLNEDSHCNINQGSLRPKLLQNVTLIIWDEGPMINQFSFEALDRTLRDIRFHVKNSVHKPFWG